MPLKQEVKENLKFDSSIIIEKNKFYFTAANTLNHNS